MQLTFYAQGSAIEPYTITVTLSDSKLSMTCTCPAGGFKAICKHRLALIAGDPDGLFAGDPDMPVFQSWLEGSNIQSAYHALQRCEDSLSDAKKRLAAAKQRLATAITG